MRYAIFVIKKKRFGKISSRPNFIAVNNGARTHHEKGLQQGWNRTPCDKLFSDNRLKYTKNVILLHQ